MQGRTPLHIALVNRWDECVDVLLEGGDVNCGNDKVGLSDAACCIGHSRHVSSSAKVAWHGVTAMHFNDKLHVNVLDYSKPALCPCKESLPEFQGALC